MQSVLFMHWLAVCGTLFWPVLARPMSDGPIPLFAENQPANRTMLPSINLVDRGNLTYLVPKKIVELDYLEPNSTAGKSYVSQLVINSTIPILLPENSANLALMCRNTTNSTTGLNRTDTVLVQALTGPVFDLLQNYLLKTPDLQLIIITNTDQGTCNTNEERGYFRLLDYEIGSDCPSCISFGVERVQIQDFALSMKVTYGLLDDNRNPFRRASAVPPIFNVATSVQHVCSSGSPQIGAMPTLASPTATVFITVPQSPACGAPTPVQSASRDIVYVVVNSRGQTIAQALPTPGAITVYQTVNDAGTIIAQYTQQGGLPATITRSPMILGGGPSYPAGPQPDIFSDVLDTTPFEVVFQNNFNCDAACQALIVELLNNDGLMSSDQWYLELARGLDSVIANPPNGTTEADNIEYLYPEGYTFYFVQQQVAARKRWVVDQLEKRFSFFGHNIDLGPIDSIISVVSSVVVSKAVPELSSVISQENSVFNSIGSVLSTGISSVGSVISKDASQIASTISSAVSSAVSEALGPHSFSYNHVYSFSLAPGADRPSPFGKPGFHIPGFPLTIPLPNAAKNQPKNPSGTLSGLYIDAYCLDCSLIGSATVQGAFIVDILAGKANDISFEIDINAALHLELGIQLIGSVQYSFSQPFVSIGLPGLSIPAVFTVGPQLLGEVGLSILTEASLEFSAGVILTFKDARVRLSATDIASSGAFNFAPKVDLIYPALTGDAKIVITPFARVALELGIQVLGNVFSAAAGVAAQVGLGFEAEGAFNISGVALGNGKCALNNVPSTLAMIGNNVVGVPGDSTGQHPIIALGNGANVVGNGIQDALYPDDDQARKRQFTRGKTPDDRRSNIRIGGNRILPAPSLTLSNPQRTGYYSSPTEYCSNGIQLSTYLEVTVYAFFGFASRLSGADKIGEKLGTNQFNLFDRVFPIAAKCIQLPAAISTTLCDILSTSTAGAGTTSLTTTGVSATQTTISSRMAAASSASGISTGGNKATSSIASGVPVSNSISAASASRSGSAARSRVIISTAIPTTRALTSAGRSSTSSTSSTPTSSTGMSSSTSSSSSGSSTSASSSITSTSSTTSTSSSSSSSTTATSTCATVAGGQPAASTPSGIPWTYQGCYSQTGSQLATDIMTTQSTTTDSVTNCVKFCSDSGNVLAAIQGTSCMCSQTTTSQARGLQKVSDAMCNTNCSGDCAQSCGGPAASVIYELQQPS